VSCLEPLATLLLLVLGVGAVFVALNLIDRARKADEARRVALQKLILEAPAPR